jgi:hypothetical protein
MFFRASLIICALAAWATMVRGDLTGLTMMVAGIVVDADNNNKPLDDVTIVVGITESAKVGSSVSENGGLFNVVAYPVPYNAQAVYVFIDKQFDGNVIARLEREQPQGFSRVKPVRLRVQKSRPNQSKEYTNDEIAQQLLSIQTTEALRYKFKLQGKLATKNAMLTKTNTFLEGLPELKTGRNLEKIYYAMEESMDKGIAKDPALQDILFKKSEFLDLDKSKRHELELKSPKGGEHGLRQMRTIEEAPLSGHLFAPKLWDAGRTIAWGNRWGIAGPTRWVSGAVGISVRP